MASRFVSDFAVKIFVHCEKYEAAITSIINENRRLGQHSDIVTFQMHSWWRYIWGSPSSRPFGLKTMHYLQCECGTLRSQNVKMKYGYVVWRCRNSACQWTQHFGIKQAVAVCEKGWEGWVAKERAAVDNAPEWYREGAIRAV